MTRKLTQRQASTTPSSFKNRIVACLGMLPKSTIIGGQRFKYANNMKVIMGTGQLGMAVMEVLLQNNPSEQLLLVNRTGKLDKPTPRNIEVMAADVTDKNKVDTIAQKAELIFSCTDVPYQSWGEFYPATAAALAYALSKTKTKLVFADNMYSYGNVLGAEMHENLPHIAKTKKGVIRASVINSLLYSGLQFSDRVAFVKAADFIGPNIYKGVFGTDFLEKLMQDKPISLFGNADLPHTFTFIKDFAKAMVNVGAAADAFGQIWHVPNAPAISLRTWVHLFETETNKKAKVLVLPKAVIWAAGLFNPLIREFYELSYQFEHPYLVNHDKYVARFGNHSTNPLAIIQETTKWFVSKNINH